MSTLNSKVGICNFALNDIGHSTVIQSLTEDSTAASTCNLVYDRARQAVLADHDWGFARSFKPLAQLDTDIPSYWTYAYILPANSLRIIRLHDATWTRQEDTRRLDYEVANVTEGGNNYRVIFTNVESAVCTFIKDLDDPTQYPHQFVEALAGKIASLIAFPLTGDQTLRRDMEQIYMIRLSAARQFDNSQGADSTDWFTPAALEARA